MKRRLKRILTVNFPLLLIIASTFPQCNGCEDPAFIPLSEDFKSYTDFPEGSWWVYENIDEPSVKDSVYVTRRFPGTETDHHTNLEYAINAYTLIKENKGNREELKYLAYPPPWTNSNSPFFYYELIVQDIGMFGTYMLFFPNEIGDKDSENCNVQIADKQDTTFMRKQSYFDTITTKFPDQGGCESPNYYIASETYARDVGVIRRTYFDGSIYELVDYHINW